MKNKKSKLEYIWLDGYKPTQSLRSKTKVVKNFSGKLKDCPVWSFDGSSTKQAPGGSSDCIWNGSGMHANFSNSALRNAGKKEIFEKVCKSFAPLVKEHIEIYGADNHLRLTGKHETQSINQFSFGVSDRGASIRIPIATVERGWKGWLEDRRPNSSADPYKVAARIIKTVKAVKL